MTFWEPIVMELVCGSQSLSSLIRTLSFDGSLRGMIHRSGKLASRTKVNHDVEDHGAKSLVNPLPIIAGFHTAAINNTAIRPAKHRARIFVGKAGKR